MRRVWLRLVVSIIWVVVAVIEVFSGDTLMALLNLLLGVVFGVFAYLAWKKIRS